MPQHAAAAATTAGRRDPRFSFKRLIAAQDATQRGQTGDPTPHAAAINSLTGLLVAVLAEITRLVTADSLMGS